MHTAFIMLGEIACWKIHMLGKLHARMPVLGDLRVDFGADIYYEKDTDEPQEGMNLRLRNSSHGANLKRQLSLFLPSWTLQTHCRWVLIKAFSIPMFRSAIHKIWCIQAQGRSRWLGKAPHPALLSDGTWSQIAQTCFVEGNLSLANAAVEKQPLSPSGLQEWYYVQNYSM